MATREHFGDYLLLKKISEDPLGESFRAGRVGSQGLERVVLLRVFNGPRIDGVRIAEELPQRAALQQALRSPNIGSGVDLGEVRGVPFVAYDYISGKNLATLLGQVDQQSSPIPLDHALLIGERLALALAAAYETRVQDHRVTHGFVAPPLVMISNEGETRLLGFEVSPILAEMAGRGVFEPTLTGYLAPEIRDGSSPGKTDDVYSLGAILFELITGRRPAGDTAGLAEEIDRALVAADETPIPPPIAALLKKSLVPREQRIPEAVTWHKALSKVMIDSGHSATTFNLAFFMHNVFRAEIEREAREMEEEKRIAVAVPGAAAPETAAEEALPPDHAIDALSDTTAVRNRYAVQAAEARPGKGIWIALLAVLVVATAATAWYLLRPRPEPEAPVIETQVEPPVTVPEPEVTAAAPGEEGEPMDLVEPEEPAHTGPSAEELQTQIQGMLEAQSREMEARFKAQYDTQIQRLQKQLEETQEAAAQAREEAAQRQARQEEERTETARRPPPPEETPAAVGETAATPTGSPPGSNLGDPEPAAEPTAGTGPAQQLTPAASRPATTTPPAAPPEPVQTRPEPVRPSQIKPPQLLRRPNPRYPDIARRMGREATILIRVLVNEEGRVIDVELLGKRIGSGLDEAALDAARQARYEPGTEDGKPARMWTTLRFEFRP